MRTATAHTRAEAHLGLTGKLAPRLRPAPCPCDAPASDDSGVGPGFGAEDRAGFTRAKSVCASRECVVVDSSGDWSRLITVTLGTVMSTGGT